LHDRRKVRDFHAPESPIIAHRHVRAAASKPAWYRTILILYRELEFFSAVNIRAILSHRFSRISASAFSAFSAPSASSSVFPVSPSISGAIQSEGQISEKMSHLDIVQIWKVYS
jgi:hypothetical protein